MKELTSLTAIQLAAGIRAKDFKSQEVTESFLNRIETVDTEINAFITVNSEFALEAAKQVDQKVQRGAELSPLSGVPVALKDLVCYDQLPTTAASKILDGWMPPYNATITERLQQADAIIIGKTNLDEFAMGSSTETSYFGPTRNPWDLERVPGGSGGGSAAAVASLQAPIAIGTDTGGSIRQPGALTGTIGVKPTYGGVSRYGVIAMASSLDQPGPCAKSVQDAALLHQIIAGYDPKDSTSINTPVPDLLAAATAKSVAGLKVGVVKELSGDGYDPGVITNFEIALEQLQAGGAEIVEVYCPNFEYAMAAYYLIMTAEVSSNLARYDGIRYGLRSGDDGTRSVEEVMKLTRRDGFSKETKRRIILGTYALSSGYYNAYYGSAQKVRTLVSQDFLKAFEKCDVLVSPSTPTLAFKIGERIDDPMAMYLADLCTIPANLAGISAGSFPSGLSDDLPTGIQVMAPVLGDAMVYQVGGFLEEALESTWGGPLLSQLNINREADGAK